MKLVFQKQHTIVVVVVVSEQHTKQGKKARSQLKDVPVVPDVHARQTWQLPFIGVSAEAPPDTHRSNCEATEGRKTSANSSDSSRRCQLAAPDTSIMTIINQQAANRLYLPQQLGKSAGCLMGGAGRDSSFGETGK